MVRIELISKTDPLSNAGRSIDNLQTLVSAEKDSASEDSCIPLLVALIFSFVLEQSNSAKNKISNAIRRKLHFDVKASDSKGKQK